MGAIEARECQPPRGCQTLYWRVLTALPVPVWRWRWRNRNGPVCGIEVFHKVLKSGCGSEAAQLETAARLERNVAAVGYMPADTAGGRCLAGAAGWPFGPAM